MFRWTRWLPAIVLAVLLTGCQGSEERPNEMPIDETMLGQQVTDYLTEQGFDAAQITHLELAGDYRLYETSVQAYELAYTWSGNAEPISGRYAFFEVSQDGAPVRLLEVRELGENSLEEAALSVGWRVNDVEYTISRDGYPGYYGLGGYGLGLAGDNIANYKDEVWPEGEPIYSEGSYYGVVSMDGLTYTYYFDADEAGEDDLQARHIITLSTTRTDMETYRGARVGMSREGVLERYPQLREPPLWSYEGDYLWLGSELGFGNLLLLYFEDDMVARIELVNMFD